MNAGNKPHLRAVPDGTKPKQAQAAAIHDKWIKGRAVPDGTKPKQAQAAAIHDKWIKGSTLTDHEVIWGSEFYRKLSDQLIQCGPVFALASQEANRTAIALEDFKQNRGI